MTKRLPAGAPRKRAPATNIVRADVEAEHQTEEKQEKQERRKPSLAPVPWLKREISK